MPAEVFSAHPLLCSCASAIRGEGTPRLSSDRVTKYRQILSPANTGNSKCPGYAYLQMNIGSA